MRRGAGYAKRCTRTCTAASCICTDLWRVLNPSSAWLIAVGAREPGAAGCSVAAVLRGVAVQGGGPRVRCRADAAAPRHPRTHNRYKSRKILSEPIPLSSSPDFQEHLRLSTSSARSGQPTSTFYVPVRCRGAGGCELLHCGAGRSAAAGLGLPACTVSPITTHSSCSLLQRCGRM